VNRLLLSLVGNHASCCGIVFASKAYCRQQIHDMKTASNVKSMSRCLGPLQSCRFAGAFRLINVVTSNSQPSSSYLLGQGHVSSRHVNCLQAVCCINDEVLTNGDPFIRNLVQHGLVVRDC